MTMISKSKDVWMPIVVRKIFKVEHLSRLPHHVRRLEDPRRSEGAGQLPGRSQLHRGVSCLSSCGFTIKFFIYRYGLLSNVSGMCQARRTHRCMKLLELHLRTLMPFAGESSCMYLDYVTLIVISSGTTTSSPLAMA